MSHWVVYIIGSHFLTITFFRLISYQSEFRFLWTVKSYGKLELQSNSTRLKCVVWELAHYPYIIFCNKKNIIIFFIYYILGEVCPKSIMKNRRSSYGNKSTFFELFFINLFKLEHFLCLIITPITISLRNLIFNIIYFRWMCTTFFFF